MKQKVRFVNTDKTQYYNTLKARVDQYFLDNNIPQQANVTMMFKTIVMLSLYFLPLTLIYMNILGVWGMWLCSATMGLGLAGIGMSVMHDANHDAYTTYPVLNKIIAFSLTLVGGDNRNWKTQHNVLHHTYTNVHGLDRDIDDKAIMRFSPAGKYKKVQRLQVFYVFVFYSILTLYWTTAKDFIQYVEFNKGGHHRDSKSQKIFNLLKLIFCIYDCIAGHNSSYTFCRCVNRLLNPAYNCRTGIEHRIPVSSCGRGS
jgi:linoleoyl-CoA desaturase